jgi:hypothetical protein
MSEQPKTLGPSDEPQYPGAIVAVHYGDYQLQECWVRSGSNLGNWYCLGGEFGVPRHGADELPLHPAWRDVLARGPVTLLSAGDKDTYAAGWANGRRRMVEQMEEVADDER